MFWYASNSPSNAAEVGKPPVPKSLEVQMIGQILSTLWMQMDRRWLQPFANWKIESMKSGIKRCCSDDCKTHWWCWLQSFMGRCLSRSQTPGHLEAFRTMWGFSKLWDAWTVFREPCLFWVHTQAGQMYLFWMKRPGISTQRRQHNAMRQKAKYRNITCEKTATHQNSTGFRRILSFVVNFLANHTEVSSRLSDLFCSVNRPQVGPAVPHTSELRRSMHHCPRLQARNWNKKVAIFF